MEAPETLSEIAREHQLLLESIEVLGRVVGSLHDKLQPVVLRRPQAVASDAKNKEPNCYSDIGKIINSATAGVIENIERLHELLNSLAV